MSTGAVRGSSADAGTSSGSSRSVAAVQRKLYYHDVIKAEPNLEGCDEATFQRAGDKYTVRWDKEVVDYDLSSKKVGTEYKHGHVALRVTYASVDGKASYLLSDINVTMQMLPSERCPTGMVQLYNFIVSRRSSDRKRIENVILCAILSMYRSDLAIFANEALEVVGLKTRCIGTFAHEYLCRRFGLGKNDMGNCVLRMGAFLKNTRASKCYAPSSMQVQNRGEAARTAASSSSNSGVESGDDSVMVRLLI